MRIGVGSLGRIRGFVPFLVTVASLAIMVGLLGFSASLNPIDVLMGRGRLQHVPDLTGMPLPGARAEAEGMGLKVELRHAFSLSVARGSIIRTDPAAGERIRAGDELIVVVSDGENSATMPDAVGEPLKDVRKPLDDARIRVKLEKVASESVSSGIVMAQDPRPGVVVRGGQTAHFKVSTGPEKRPVPELAGLTPEGAAFKLGEAGLVLGDMTLAADPLVPVGAVTRSVPAQGQVVDKGTETDLFVSAGPQAKTVPDIVAQSREAAEKALEAAGFTVGVSRQMLPAGDPGIGMVAAQDPVGGTEHSPGIPVRIVIGVGPPPPPPTTTTTTTTTTVATTTTSSTAGNGGD